MRFVFKTHYDQDIRVVKHGGQAFWYSMLMVVMLWWRRRPLLVVSLSVLFPC